MAVIGIPSTHLVFEIPEGSTSVRRSIFIAADTGEPKEGLVKADFLISDGAAFSYFRDDASAVVDAKSAADSAANALTDSATLGTWVTSGFKLLSDSLMGGWYEVGFPDAAFVKTANGKSQANVVFTIQADDTAICATTQVTFILTKVTPANSVQRFTRKANDVNVRENVYFTDEQTGLGKTGLSKTSFTIADAAEFAYFRGDAAAAVDAKFDATTCLGDTTTLGTFVSATLKEISSALMPGWYEVHFPNAAFIINQTSGVKPRSVTFCIKPELAANAQMVNVIFDLFRSVAR